MFGRMKCIYKSLKEAVTIINSIREQLVLLNKKVNVYGDRLNQLEEDNYLFKSNQEKQLETLKKQERYADLLLQRYMYETLRIGNNNNLFSFPHLGETITMFLPFCSFDHIQFEILSRASFFEKEELELVRSKYFNLNKENVTLDIGANIGNHSLFFSKFCNSKVFSFEPQNNLCEIALRNYELNGVQDKVKIIRKALGNIESTGSFASFDSQNTGATKVKISTVKRDIQIIPLDKLDFDQIDFIKIDVEGFEEQILIGGRKNFSNCACPIWIEIFPASFNVVKNMLSDFGYILAEKLNNHNYIFIPNTQGTQFR